MSKIFEQIFKEIEAWIQNYEMENNLTLEKTKIRILGQLALFLHPDPRLKQLDLAATRDLDAIIKGANPVIQKLKAELKKQSLVIDIDSEKIWLPKGHHFTNIYQSVKLEVDVLDPLFALVSKAVKAKEKNRILIRNALKVFNNDLEKLIKQEGASLEYFQKP